MFSPAFCVHIRDNEITRTLQLDSRACVLLDGAVKCRCFNAGIAMRDLALHAPRCLLLTSGTLSPLDSFAFELQTPFPIRLENPHIIGAQQVCA